MLSTVEARAPCFRALGFEWPGLCLTVERLDTVTLNPKPSLTSKAFEARPRNSEVGMMSS